MNDDVEIPDPEEEQPSDSSEDSAEDPRKRFRRLTEETDSPPEEFLEKDESATGEHPTGAPDLTGGWYTQSDTKTPTEPEAEESHPTGDPALTGGWFGQPADPNNAEPEEAEAFEETEAPKEQPAEDETQGSELPQELVPPDSRETVALEEIISSTPPPPPPLGTTPPAPPIEIDSQGMPLPRRVHETDLDATQVSQAAYQPPQRPTTPPPPPSGPTASKPRPKRNWIAGMGCVVRMAILSLFAAALIIL
jgi:hypothetical protein